MDNPVYAWAVAKLIVLSISTFYEQTWTKAKKPIRLEIKLDYGQQ